MFVTRQWARTRPRSVRGVRPSVLGGWTRNSVIKAKGPASLLLNCPSVAMRAVLERQWFSSFSLKSMIAAVISGPHTHCSLALATKSLLMWQSSFTTGKRSNLSSSWKTLEWSHSRNWKSPRKFSPPKVGTLSRPDPCSVSAL